MNILQLCNKVPYPEKDGGAMGVSFFTKALLKVGNRVKMLTMNTSKHFVSLDSVPEKLKTAIELEALPVNTALNPFKALIALLSNRSYNISRFYFREFETRLAELLKNEKFDIIQLESLFLTPYIKTIRSITTVPIILREHNIEWLIWDRLANKEKNILKKQYLKILTRQLKNYEKKAVNLCDGITTTTVNDKRRLEEMGCKVPIMHIPFGIDTSVYKPLPPENKATLFYIGALDWLPNLQGLDWFLHQVWPKVHTNFPKLEFHVAGRNMPEKYKFLSIPGITFHGEVESAAAFINKYDIMPIPLLAGSGIRVKIIEGMALQKPIITTHVGIEGIECSYGNDVLIADTPEEFYNAIKKCISEPGFCQRLAQNGKKFVEAHHNIDVITTNLMAFYKDFISKKAA